MHAAEMQRVQQRALGRSWPSRIGLARGSGADMTRHTIPRCRWFAIVLRHAREMPAPGIVAGREADHVGVRLVGMRQHRAVGLGCGTRSRAV